MKRLILILLSLVMLVTAVGCGASGSNTIVLSAQEEALHQESLTKFAQPTRWATTINAFKTSDTYNPPPQNAVLFVGSSSIVYWNTKKWFPDITTINRGFGGSEINDSLYYADAIIIPYHPKTVVFYAGDNDIASGKTPAMIFADFKALAKKLRDNLPETKIIVVSIKPSIARWTLWSAMQEANGLISKFCTTQTNFYFADVTKVMLDASGQPRNDIFVSDGLHMNDNGYELWTSVVRPIIDK